MSTTPRSGLLPLTCRPSAVLYLVAAGFTPFSGLWFWLARHQFVGVYAQRAAGMGLAFAGLSVVAILMAVLPRVCADETGIRWRRWFTWKHVRWEGILACHQHLSVARHGLTVIETRRGTIVLAESVGWTNVSLLRTEIARRVPAAGISTERRL